MTTPSDIFTAPGFKDLDVAAKVAGWGMLFEKDETKVRIPILPAAYLLIRSALKGTVSR